MTTARPRLCYVGSSATTGIGGISHARYSSSRTATERTVSNIRSNRRYGPRTRSSGNPAQNTPDLSQWTCNTNSRSHSCFSAVRQERRKARRAARAHEIRRRLMRRPHSCEFEASPELTPEPAPPMLRLSLSASENSKCRRTASTSRARSAARRLT